MQVSESVRMEKAGELLPQQAGYGMAMPISRLYAMGWLRLRAFRGARGHLGRDACGRRRRERRRCGDAAMPLAGAADARRRRSPQTAAQTAVQSDGAGGGEPPGGTAAAAHGGGGRTVDRARVDASRRAALLRREAAQAPFGC